MRIIHIINHSYRHTANVHAAVDLACTQADLGHDVIFCSVEGSFSDILAAHGVREVKLSELGGAKTAPQAVLAIRRLMSESRADVIHAHMLKATVLAWAASRIHSTRLVTTVHAAFQRSALVMALGSRVIAVSQAVAEQMLKSGFPRKTLRVVLNGAVGTPRYGALPPTPVQLHHPAVLYAGGLHPRKGVVDLLEGFSIARRKRFDLHLYLVGEGPSELDFKRAVSDADQPFVHFCGALDDPRGYMRAADVFVLASHADPAPLMITEAREAGLAVIGTRVDGIPELLDGGRAGILVPPSDPTSIAAALLDVLATDESLADYRARGQVDLEHLSVRRVALETLAIYAELAKRAA